MVFSEYIAGHRRQLATERRLAAARAALARALAGQIAKLLAREFGATKVILFGSLPGGRFGPRSDIDIAVAGIDPARFFAAAAAAQRAGEPIDVDLVPIESASEMLRTQLEIAGVALYGD